MPTQLVANINTQEDTLSITFMTMKADDATADEKMFTSALLNAMVKDPETPKAIGVKAYGNERTNA